MLRTDFLVKNSDWCRFQSLDPLTGYLSFLSHLERKKKKGLVHVVTSNESYILMTRIITISIIFQSYWLTLTSSHHAPEYIE